LSEHLASGASGLSAKVLLFRSFNELPSAVQLHFYISTWALNFVKEHKTKHNKMTKNIHTDRNIGIQLDVELQKVFGGCCECSE